MRNRIKIIDYLKTIAIISVVFYHIGILPNGYIGVEIFFVISGFLYIKSLNKVIKAGKFNSINFILKKVSEFWPLIAVSGIVCLLLGYFVMLPDDFENLSESVVASNFFANNILQAITTKDYWAIGNTYKPLMHLWYIAVLLQMYIITTFILAIANKFTKKDCTLIIIVCLLIISLSLYFIPRFQDSDKFYYFPFRLFEFLFGGLIALIPSSKKIHLNNKLINWGGKTGFCILLILILVDINLSSSILLLLTVFITGLIIYIHTYSNDSYLVNEKIYTLLSIPGKCSYVIYIWHQVVIAFLYYFIFQKINIQLVLLTITMTVILSYSTTLIRTKCKFLNNVKYRLVFSISVVLATSIISLIIYSHAGVVRNIPELGIEVNNVHRNMHAEYVDIPYAWDNDFKEDSKIHILVMGNSFGRDFANILNESSISNEIEISYIFGDDASEEKDRIEDADYIFYSNNLWYVSTWILENVSRDKLYIVGNKEFGNSNGIIYKNRNSEWYFEQRVEITDEFIQENKLLKNTYQDHYIDMITPLMEDNKIAVFTDDGHFISQDCRHLTKYGARYYSKILDLSFITE